MPGTATFPATVVLMLWCALSALTADARATPLDRVEFESASERTGAVLSPGDRIQGDLVKPDGVGPFPAVIVLHGCAGMHDTTKRKLVDELVAWGYAILRVDSYATRRIEPEQACISLGALPPSPNAGGMPTELWSSWVAKASPIHTVSLWSASR